MGELARQRRTRELRLSRSHLGAAGVGIGVVTVTAFILGLLMARGGEPNAPVAPISMQAQVADENLVDLLARVEASADPKGGISEFTFPKALVEDSVALSVPSASVGEGEAGATIRQGPVTETVPDAAPMPAGEVTIQVAVVPSEQEAQQWVQLLRQSGHPAWKGTIRSEDGLVHRIAVGGFSSHEVADPLLKDVQATVESLGLDTTVELGPMHP